MLQILCLTFNFSKVSLFLKFKLSQEFSPIFSCVKVYTAVYLFLLMGLFQCLYHSKQRDNEDVLLLD